MNDIKGRISRWALGLSAAALIIGNPTINDTIVNRMYANMTLQGNTLTVSNSGDNPVFIEDSQKQFTLYGNPLFNIGDVKRSAYQLDEPRIEGEPKGNDSIIQSNGKVWSPDRTNFAYLTDTNQQRYRWYEYINKVN